MGNRIFGVECLLASYLLDYPQKTFFGVESIKKEQRLKPGGKLFFVHSLDKTIFLCFLFLFLGGGESPLMFCQWLVLHQRTCY